MKTIRVQYDEPARSKSRNVNAYTRAMAKRAALKRALTLAEVEVNATVDKLTGEARRLGVMS